MSMSLSRRDFLKALAQLAAVAADPAGDHTVYLPFVSRGGGAYAHRLGEGAWAIGNPLIEQRLAFSNGGLVTTSLLHKASGRDWCSPAIVSPVFFLREQNADLDSASGWSLVGHATSTSGDEASLSVTVQHAMLPIRMRAHFHAWADAPVVRAWTEYENLDSALRALQGQSFCNLVMNPAGNLEAVWVAPFSWIPGHTNDSFTLHRETLGANQSRHLVIGPYAAEDVNGYNVVTYRPSCGWFAFQHNGLGAGLFGGVEWSGACEARLWLNGEGQGAVGIDHWRPEFMHVTLPGEKVASPVAWLGVFAGSLDEAAGITRDVAVKHYAPPVPAIRVPSGAEVPYVMADTWGYGSDIDEVGLRAFIDTAAEIGVERVTIDEGWEARLGDWVSHPTRFPSGLRATIDYVHSRGMAAGLWFAFASVDPESQVAKGHPDWLATQGGVPFLDSEGFNAHVLCLSHPDARAWVAAEFDRLIDAFDVDGFVQDFKTIARCDNPAHAAWHQPTDSEYRNVLALWDLIDGVRARHPRLMLENNWSGARVMDFGMLRRYDASLCDDYNQAARNRAASFGVTHFFPPAFISKYMGAESLPFDYQTRSYFFGGPWNLMVDLPAQDTAALSSAVAAYKALRASVRDGRVYHLAAPTLAGSNAFQRYQVAWDAMESADAAGRWAVLLVGRGLGGGDTFTVRPLGLIPSATYALASSSGAVYGSRSGSDLMANGIDVSLPERSHETIVLTA